MQIYPPNIRRPAERMEHANIYKYIRGFNAITLSTYIDGCCLFYHLLLLQFDFLVKIDLHIDPFFCIITFFLCCIELLLNTFKPLTTLQNRLTAAYLLSVCSMQRFFVCVSDDRVSYLCLFMLNQGDGDYLIPLVVIPWQITVQRSNKRPQSYWQIFKKNEEERPQRTRALLVLPTIASQPRISESPFISWTNFSVPRQIPEYSPSRGICFTSPKSARTTLFKTPSDARPLD